MENPNTWTTLHYELFEAGNTGSIQLLHFILEQNGYNVSHGEVEQVVINHWKCLDEGVCGYSLPTQLLNQFADRKS